jgi:hypothetical protein
MGQMTRDFHPACRTPAAVNPAEGLLAKVWNYSAPSKSSSVRYVTARPRERAKKETRKDDNCYEIIIASDTRNRIAPLDHW